MLVLCAIVDLYLSISRFDFRTQRFFCGWNAIEHMANSLNMVFDGDELLELPYIGERLKKSSAAAPSARGMYVQN